MSEFALARRYAKALLALAEAQNAVETVQAELDGLYHALADDGEALAMLVNPCISPSAKLAALAQLAKHVELLDLTHHFVRRLVEARRIAALGDICSVFRALARERAGALDVQVTSARPIPDAQRDALQQALEARTGKRIVMAVDIDPTLLGGARVRIGNLLLDGSAHARLRVLGDRLTQGRVHED